MQNQCFKNLVILSVLRGFRASKSWSHNQFSQGD